MQITRQADYAVRAMVYLAQLEVKWTRAITRRHGSNCPRKEHSAFFPGKNCFTIISCRFTKNISRRTWRCLTRQTGRTISLLDVIEAIDGPILLNDCVGDFDDLHL